MIYTCIYIYSIYSAIAILFYSVILPSQLTKCWNEEEDTTHGRSKLPASKWTMDSTRGEYVGKGKWGRLKVKAEVVVMMSR